MDLSALAQQVSRLALGKRLPEAVYIHSQALPRVSEELRAAVAAAVSIAQLEAGAFDVIKFARRGTTLSLLGYPDFFAEPFPCLTDSWVVDLGTGAVTHRAYAADGNPPILHRKELLLPPDHPRLAEFAALTAQAVQFGLFEDTNTIGTKKAWAARLARMRLQTEGHRLIETPGGAPTQHTSTSSITTTRGPKQLPDQVVLRHRTAMQRYSLSTPMQALFRHGYLDGGATVFDYGCGRGGDVRILKELGLDAAGWDPHFAADNEKRPANVVNLGFVINVIEDERERRAALAGAYALAGKVLAVAALIGGRTAYEQHRLFRDGVLTTRGTFQRYFTQQELREYLEETLGREPIAVAPGLFFVFRDDAEEQRFLAARQTQARCPVRLPKMEVDRPERPRKAARLSRWEQHRELLENFWSRCLELGRLPKEAEYARLHELRGALGAPQTVLRKLREERGEASLEAARRARIDDLVVFFALNLFERRRSFKLLPVSLQRDIAAFWGSYALARAEATQLLLSLGQTEVICRACANAARMGTGHLDGEHSLALHASLVPQLPPVLRIYVGCASRLYGEVEVADLVKIHMQSGKLSLMVYDDFMGKPLPRLLERVKIDLRAQRVQFFDYGREDKSPPLLHGKARYMAAHFDHYEEQMRFDAAMAGLGIDLAGFGPDARTLEEEMRRRDLTVEGFQLIAGGQQNRRSAP